MRNRMIIAVITAAASTPIYADGIMAGLISGAVSGITNIGRSAYDKATEKSPEEEAAARQKLADNGLAAYKKALEAVETNEKASPLDKERLALILKGQHKMQADMLAAQAIQEQQARAERANALSGVGILGSLGKGLASGVASGVQMNLQMDQAELNAKRLAGHNSNIPQSKQADIASQAHDTAQNSNSAEMMQTLRGGAPADLATYKSQDPAAMTLVRAQLIAKGIYPGSNIEDVNPQYRKFEVHETFPPAFKITDDKSRKIYVAFNGSESMTQKLHELFAARGYQLVDNQNEAEVSYGFSGEYHVAENEDRKSTDAKAEDIVNGVEVKKPEAKPRFGKVLFAVLTEATTSSRGNYGGRQLTSAYDQNALVVINRHVAGERDMRVSASAGSYDFDLQADSLVKASMELAMMKGGEDIQLIQD